MAYVVSDMSKPLEVFLLVACCFMVLEITFYFYIRIILHPRLCKLKTKHETVPQPLEHMQRMVMVMEQLAKKGVYTPEGFIKGWALGAKTLSDVKKDNLYSFLSWAFFCETYDQIKENKASLKQLNKIYSFLETSFPAEMAQIEDGYNPAVSHPNMCLTQEFPILHRPLFLYAVLKFMDMCTEWVVMPYMGFKYGRMDSYTLQPVVDGTANRLLAEHSGDGGSGEPEQFHIQYWLREKADSQESPAVYFHGITHGWWNYLPAIDRLTPNRSVILVSLDNIKMASLNTKANAPPPKIYANAVEAILQHHHITQQVTIVGHSFGSMTTSWFVKYFPERVKHVILVDPVALLLILPNVAVNFLYRNPQTCMEWLIYLAAGREITIAHTMYRNFQWQDNILWLEDLPDHCSCTTLVCGKDDILHGPSVHAYSEHYASQLAKSGTTRNHIYYPDYAHGDLMWRGADLAGVEKLIRLGTPFTSLSVAPAPAPVPEKAVLVLVPVVAEAEKVALGVMSEVEVSVVVST
jgi:pimeloyl-ACP methyl ester carboxylesterase